MKTPFFSILFIAAILAGGSAFADGQEIPDPRCSNVTSTNVLPELMGGKPYPVPDLNFACNKIFCDPKTPKLTREDIFRFKELLNEIDRRNILFDQGIPDFERICQKWDGKENSDEGQKEIRKSVIDTTALFMATKRHIKYALEWAAEADAEPNGKACGDRMRTFVEKKNVNLGKSALRFKNANCSLSAELKAGVQMQIR